MRRLAALQGGASPRAIWPRFSPGGASQYPEASLSSRSQLTRLATG
jgi:hypothetical protein